MACLSEKLHGHLLRVAKMASDTCTDSHFLHLTNAQTSDIIFMWTHEIIYIEVMEIKQMNRIQGFILIHEDYITVEHL